MAESYLRISNSNMSYLKARDPSILAYNFNLRRVPKVRNNLLEEFGERTQQPVEEPKDENIRVYLRIKSGYSSESLYDINGNSLTSKVPPGSNFMRNVKDGDSMKKTYTFTKIFEPGTTQRDVFNSVVKAKLLDFINGQNSTLLTYGASGSGKTFTVIGTDEEPGVVPRSLEYLFRTLPHLSQGPEVKPSPSGDVTILNETDRKKEKYLCRSLLNVSSSSMDRNRHIRIYDAMRQRLSTEPVAELEGHAGVSLSVWVSFAEIYNEQIYDLLQFDPPRGQKRPKLRLGMSNGHAYIKNLTNVSVTSGQEAYQILQYGIHNLNYASTQINKRSSRSHSIFTIKLVQMSEANGGGCCVSCFNFCDLAGSERTKKTHNIGDRLKESNNINSSLMVLGRCIAAIRDSQKQSDQRLIPFRESKLTQLFQKALAGSEDIAMIVNMSPVENMFDETQHVLNFAAIAKNITIERKPDPPKKKTRFSTLVERGAGIDPPINRRTSEEYERLLSELEEQLEIQRIELETNNQINLDYLRHGYQDILKQHEEDAQRRVEDAKKGAEKMFELKLNMMKLKYEERIDEIEGKYANGIIEISSSEDEGEEKSRPKRSVLAQTLAEGVEGYRELQQAYNMLQMKYDDLESKCLELETEVQMLKDELAIKIWDEMSETSEEGTDEGFNGGAHMTA